MKTEKPKGGAILTLMIAQNEAERISDWVAENLGRTVVELKKPGGTECALEIYFDNTIEAEIAARALEQFPIKGRAIREYADEEWAESWKKHFKPMDIGQRLRVVPPWLANSGDRNQESEVSGEKIEIVINPGLSFGTGNHFTTRFCLEQLDRFVPQSGAKTMLDVGTGSGVLAIAAVKLGAEQALGVDFDPICVECSIENAEANGVADKTAFRQHDITDGWPNEKYDIVCANIYSTLLIDNASTLLRIAGKYLLLTGIREMELDGVADTFVRLGGREIVRDCDNEWGGLVISIL
ncbi:MAG: 50S ribosomal protein L11 methyltransferase [Kiritimatiellaceae bacterium]|nr:50S ribosomal protein L11 methyltransferase [Kiritimatiellaceae bacterium]